MKNTLGIAGFRYAYEGELPSFTDFVLPGTAVAEGSIRFKAYAYPSPQATTMTLDLEHMQVHQLPEGAWLYTSPAGRPPVQLVTNPAYDEVTVYLPPWENKQAQNQTAEQLLRTALECRFCCGGIVSLHGACVELDGEAVVFTGESGLGKSTRAAAWAEGLGAQWISGDRPALDAAGKRMYGVPWDGKEQHFFNVQVPLKAILEVRRAASTALRKLSPAQARRLLMRQCFLPMWDTEAAASAMLTVRRAANTLPIYRLFCGPEVTSAQEVYALLYHSEEKILEVEKEMKIKEGFILRKIVGESIVMPTGDQIAAFDGAVVLNELSAFIFEALQHPVSREDVLRMILDEYEVDAETAGRDLDTFLEQLSEMALLEKE